VLTYSFRFGAGMNAISGLLKATYNDAVTLMDQWELTKDIEEPTISKNKSNISNPPSFIYDCISHCDPQFVSVLYFPESYFLT